MENICRLCGLSNSSLIPIFSFDNGRLISDLIILICPIVIDETENLPKNICKKCLIIIRNAQELREQSVINDLKFRNFENSLAELHPHHQTVVIKNEFDESSEEIFESKYESNYSDDNYDPDYTFEEAARETKPEKPEKIRKVREPKEYKGKSVTCKICNVKIPHSTSNYRRHIITHHDSSLKFPCSLCTYRFPSSAKLKSHGEKVHNENDIARMEEDESNTNGVPVYHCDMCRSKFLDKQSITSHIMRKHLKEKNNPHYGLPQENFSCDHCDRIFTTSSNLYRHITSTHPDKQPKCSLCNEQFKTEKLLARHLERDHGVDPITNSEALNSTQNLLCHFCNEDCGTSKNNYERHLINEHGNQLEKIFSCAVCNKQFVYENSLKQHAAFHRRQTLEKNYQFTCNQCNKRFPNKERFDKHISTHSQVSLICHICGKHLKNKFSYDFHVKRHAEKREFPCHLCPASFVYNKQLERHIESHSEERKHVCNYDGCGKTFKDAYTYKKHMKRHQGLIERKYACHYDACGKKFFSKFALDRHILTHTCEKPHRCEYCEMAYAQKNDLIKHKKIHVGDNIYQCTIEGCLAAFRLQAELKKHYSVHYVQSNDYNLF